jgi:hypothetical protein
MLDGGLEQEQGRAFPVVVETAARGLISGKDNGKIFDRKVNMRLLVTVAHQW